MSRVVDIGPRDRRDAVAKRILDPARHIDGRVGGIDARRVDPVDAAEPVQIEVLPDDAARRGLCLKGLGVTDHVFYISIDRDRDAR
jgi:hypothetical protein